MFVKGREVGTERETWGKCSCWKVLAGKPSGKNCSANEIKKIPVNSVNVKFCMFYLDRDCFFFLVLVLGREV